MQQLAEQAVAQQLAKLDRVYAKRGKRLAASIVALDPHTGKVLAMVGGRSYADSQFNRATDAKRQPGSTFKPIVYATALERGYTEISTFADRPMEFMYASVKPYKPSNFRDGYSMTNLTLKSALAKSSNVIAIQTAMAVGLENVAAKARKFGFENVNTYPSMPLGTSEVTPLQLAAAYASFANGGTQVVPTFIDTVVSGDGRVTYASQPSAERVVSERTAYMITDMLEAVVQRGTARSANGALGKDVVFAGKTGSSKDGWFVGYTPNLVTVAWIGFDDNTDVQSTGGEIALPLWTAFMQDVIKAMPEYGGRDFDMPEGLVEMVVDPESGMLADRYCPHSEKVVLPRSSASNVRCLLHQPQPEVLLASAETGDQLSEPVVNEIPAAVSAEIAEPAVPTQTFWEESERNVRPRKAVRAAKEEQKPEQEENDDYDQ
jgi:penicillin-binding protein 1B